MKIENKLDFILRYFENKGHDNLDFDKQNLIWGELAIKVADGNNNYFLMLLNRLKSDGFIENKTFNYYVITISGLIFLRQKGYTQKQIDLDKERTRIVRNDTIIVFSTMIAAIGTVFLIVCEFYK